MEKSSTLTGIAWQAIPAAGLTVLLAIALGGPQFALAVAFFSGSLPTPEQASAVVVVTLWALFVSVLGWCIWSAIRALGAAWIEESRQRHQEQIRQLLLG
jgi:protein-S-isoprenylcysteine O-methyltransferase Ste14